jgi:hypothetical protein
VLACATLLCALLAGCGSSHSSGTSTAPSTVVPATAALYLEADVRPEGNEKSNAVAAGQALTHQKEPYARLVQALQTPGSPPLQFDRDVAPWLGPHAGAFVTSLAAANGLAPLLQQALLGSQASLSFPFATAAATGALVLDTSDLERARSFVRTQAAHAGAQPTSYRGVSYEVSPGGVAFAVVSRFVVLGSEQAVRSVIDTNATGPALAHSSVYAGLIGKAPPEALAHVYAAGRTGQSPAATSSTGTGGLLRLLTGGRDANVSVVPATNSLALYADTHVPTTGTGAAGLLDSGTEAGQAFDELPGDSWLAVGLGSLGPALGADLGALGEIASVGARAGGKSPSAGLSVGGVLEGLLAPLEALAHASAHEQAELARWMGATGVFASGSGLLELKGAIVIESKNAAASRAAVGRLAALLRRSGNSAQAVTVAGTEAAASARVPGLPLMLYIAAGRDPSGIPKFVVGLGEQSIGEALHPASTMASSSARTTAASTVGEGLRPTLVFDVPMLVSLLEAVGLSEDSSISPLLPLLHGISSANGGVGSLGGGVERFKLVLGLTQSGG